MRRWILVIGMVVLIIVTLYLIFPWGALWLGLWLQPAPEEPVCKYGEFPFTLQYEINGEIKTISNTLVCKYKGIGIDEASGKKRLWEVGESGKLYICCYHVAVCSCSAPDAGRHLNSDVAMCVRSDGI